MGIETLPQIQWNVDQILVYVWQVIGGEDFDAMEYPYSKFENSEGGKMLRVQLEGLARGLTAVGRSNGMLSQLTAGHEQGLVCECHDCTQARNRPNEILAQIASLGERIEAIAKWGDARYELTLSTSRAMLERLHVLDRDLKKQYAELEQSYSSQRDVEKIFDARTLRIEHELSVFDKRTGYIFDELGKIRRAIARQQLKPAERHKKRK